MKISELTTPSFLVDRRVVERNCDTMRRKAESSGVIFRPHVKTHKSPEIGRIQHGGRPGPITVSTLAEARRFAAAGFDDITYAVPIDPAKLAEAAAIANTVRQLNLLLDHRETLRAVESFAAREAISFDLFLKVDCGYHRAGVDPGCEAAVDLALACSQSPHVRMRGLLTHAGHSYHARSREEIVGVAQQERESVAAFAARLHERGVTSLVRSIGSTPTAAVVERFEQCDEVRPGNYVFFDAYQAALGSCSIEDVAVSILATVVGIYPAEEKVIIDAGSLALTRESGYGDVPSGASIVCDENLAPLKLNVTAMSQEHGQLRGADWKQMTIGRRVRLIPNHSCIAAAMFDRFDVVEGSEVVDQWQPVRGW